MRLPRPWTLVIGASFGASLSLLALAAAAQTPPNVVLIILDDVGVEAFAAYNQGNQEVAVPPGQPPPPEHQVTTSLSQLAAEGVMFRNAWSAPVCAPTRATIFSGLYGFRTGVISGLPTGPIIPNLVTRLRDRRAPAYGVRQAIGKWHLSMWNPVTPNLADPPSALGFGVGDGSATPPGAAFRGHWGESQPGLGYQWAIEPPPDGAVTYPSEYQTTKEVDEALAFLQAQPASPWFLWLAFHAPHGPWDEDIEPPSSICDGGITGTTQADFNRRMRCRQLAVLDAEFARLRAAIDLETTVVVLVGDNGRPSGVAKIPGQINTGTKNTVKEGGINVPLIVAGAGVDMSQPEKSALVHTVDIYPTILDLAGMATPNNYIDGVSFKPVLTGTSASERTCVYTDGSVATPPGATPVEKPENHEVAIRNATHKLIRRRNSTGPIYEFYDLVSDPGEQSTLPPSGPEFDSLVAVLDELDALDEPGSEPMSPCKSSGIPPQQTGSSCGIGPEFVPALLMLAWLRARRGRRIS
jgi:arylsulfatase B